jgi:DNA repair photolyase
MLEVAERVPVAANLSVPTLDEKAWRATEPRTPNPRARLEAVRELNRAGIPTGILVAPLMPGINDDPAQVSAILELAADAGAVHVGGIALHLRGEVRRVFMDWLRSSRPDLVPRYEELYRRGAYARPSERRRLQGLIRGPGAPFGRYFGAEGPGGGAEGGERVSGYGFGTGHAARTSPPRTATEREVAQPTLF